MLLPWNATVWKQMLKGTGWGQTRHNLVAFFMNVIVEIQTKEACVCVWLTFMFQRGSDDESKKRQRSASPENK